MAAETPTGAADTPRDARAPRHGALWIVVAVLACYVASCALYWPDVITVSDEGNYVRQARMMVDGRTHLQKINPFTGRTVSVRASWYPAGTAALMTPGILAFGWRGAYTSSLLCLLLGVLGTAAWLRRAGRSPLFALLLLAFPSTLVMGRVAMSDVPSLAVVAGGLWLFWVGLTGGRRWWLGSGLLAGLSLSLREPNALLFAPFFAGAMVRRDAGWLWLLLGGLVGVAVRLALAAWIYGDPFFYKPPSVAFHLGAVAQNAGMIALGVLVFVPLGAVLAPFYRGPRRPEVVVACMAFPILYMVYGYGASESGLAQRIILSHRFLIPALPLYAFALAEVVPRAFAGLRASRSWSDGQSRAVARTGGALLVAGAAIGAIAVHPIFDHLNRHRAEVRDAIYAHTVAGGLVVTNWHATGKYIDITYGPRIPLDRPHFDPEAAAYLMKRHKEIFLVFLDRSDSAFWLEDARKNAEVVARMGSRAKPIYDRAMTSRDRLRIWRVETEPRSRWKDW